MPVEVRACGFVIFKRTPIIHYLLMQASYGSHHWTPPKGHVEAGESDLETAYRETEEEAGFQKQQLKVYEGFRKPLYYNANGQQKETVYFLAEVDSAIDVKVSHEHQSYKWLPLKEACELANFETLVDLFKTTEDYIKCNS